jgi:signal recognition particle subunit SEC65
MPIPVRDYQSADEMLAHYARIRQRTFRAKPSQQHTAPRTHRFGTGTTIWQERRAAEEQARAEIAADHAAILAEQRRVFRELTESVSLQNPPAKIIAEVAAKYGLTPADIISPSRNSGFVRARFAAIRAVYEAHPTKSLPWIAMHFKRDHSTILHALVKMGLRTRRPGSKKQ